MNIKRMSPQELVVALEGVERGVRPSRLEPEDEALLGVAGQLFRLRVQAAAPQGLPWLVGDLGEGAPPPTRHPFARFSMLDRVALVGLLVIVATVAWQVSNGVVRRIDPAVAPEATRVPLAVPDTRATPTDEPGAADGLRSRDRPEPSPSAPTSAPAPARPIGPDAAPANGTGAPTEPPGPRSVPRPADRESEAPSAAADEPMAGTATVAPSAQPYPGPAATERPETRVTRIAPPPVPTRPPVVPTRAPTSVPIPTPRPVPPTPTVFRATATPMDAVATSPVPTLEPPAVPTNLPTATQSSWRSTR